MAKIPDSTELFEIGLGSGKPYLGSPEIVEQILRNYILDIHHLRVAQVKGDERDPVQDIPALATGLQKVFYGQDDRFQAFPWNRENVLGRMLVEQAGIGGDTSDAVYRVGIRIAKEYMQNLNAFEDDRISEDYFKAELDKMVALYTRVLVGNGDRHGS